MCITLQEGPGAQTCIIEAPLAVMDENGARGGGEGGGRAGEGGWKPGTRDLVISPAHVPEPGDAVW